jgi:hypothetical protein
MTCGVTPPHDPGGVKALSPFRQEEGEHLEGHGHLRARQPNTPHDHTPSKPHSWPDSLTDLMRHSRPLGQAQGRPRLCLEQGIVDGVSTVVGGVSTRPDTRDGDVPPIVMRDGAWPEGPRAHVPPAGQVTRKAGPIEMSPRVVTLIAASRYALMVCLAPHGLEGRRRRFSPGVQNGPRPIDY